MIPFDTGVMSIDSHNYTRTSREGYVSDADYDSLPVLEYTPEPPIDYNRFTNLNPGLYRTTIEDRDYAVMLHHSYHDGDEFIIKNAADMFGIVGMHKVPTTPYILHRGLEMDNDAVILNSTCNDHLDMLVVNGQSKLVMDSQEPDQYFTHPAQIKDISMIRASVTNVNGTNKNYLMNLKSYIRGIEDKYTGKGVYDRLYLNSEQNKASFEHKIGSIRLSGYEDYKLIEEHSSNGYIIVELKMEQIKLDSNLICSHFKTITEQSILEHTGYINGIASSATEHKLYFKVNKTLFNDVESFVSGLRLESERGKPVTVLYEYTRPQYNTVMLNDYYINLFFNKTWVELGSYHSTDIMREDEKDNFIIALPDDIELVESDITPRAMYFYKHFRDWRS